VRNGGLAWAVGVLAAAAVLSGCTTTVTGAAHPGPAGGVAVGGTNGSRSFTMTPGSGGGPASVVASGAGSAPVVAVSGERFSVYLDVVFITGRMSEAELVFLSSGARLPASLRDHAVAAVAQRMAAL
jgi:hypothetical protein